MREWKWEIVQIQTTIIIQILQNKKTLLVVIIVVATIKIIKVAGREAIN